MKVAPRWKRFINHLIDSSIFYILVRVLFTRLVREGLFSPVFAVLIGIGIYLVYMFFFEAFISRSLGKIITKTRVVTEEGETPEIGKIFIRTICRLIPFNSLITLFSGKSIHERLSKTGCVNL